MTITVNDKILEQYNLSVEEFLLLYICSKEYNIKDLLDTVIAKGYADVDLYDSNRAVVSNAVKEIVSTIISFEIPYSFAIIIATIQFSIL